MKLQIEEKFVLGVIAMNHVIGWVGLNFGPYQELMVSLTPVNLLITTLLILWFVSQRNSRFVLFALFAMVFGWLTEVIGVATGKVFGEYSYTPALGPSIMGVPLMIGVNWFLLAYSIASLTSWLMESRKWHLIFMNAGLMVGADLLIEPFAVRNGLWVWATESGMPGFQNYLAWFLISIVVFSVYHLLVRSDKNKVAALTLPILLLFFLLNFLS